MSARGKVLVKRLLRRLLRDNNVRKVEGLSEKTNWTRSLKGGIDNRTAACKRAVEYLATCALEKPANVPLPSELNLVVADLRKIAGNIRTRASERIKACERLLRIEGYSVAPHGNEPLDRLLDRHYGEIAEKSIGRERDRIRKGARSQAYADVVECFKTDRAKGCFKSLGDVVLRLPEHPVPEKWEVSLAEQHRDELAGVIEMFRNRKGGNHV